MARFSSPVYNLGRRLDMFDRASDVVRADAGRLQRVGTNASIVAVEPTALVAVAYLDCREDRVV